MFRYMITVIVLTLGFFTTEKLTGRSTTRTLLVGSIFETENSIIDRFNDIIIFGIIDQKSGLISHITFWDDFWHRIEDPPIRLIQDNMEKGLLL